MIWFLVVLIAACAQAGIVEKCKVGGWSEWSECRSSRQCYNHPLVSYAMTATQEWDSGRDAMQTLMQRKTKQWNEAARCKTAGTCPERLMKPLPGSFPCDASGLAGDIPCSNIGQESFLTFEEMGYIEKLPADVNPAGNDIWGWTDPLNGDEYAIMGFTGGTSFVRITDPQNPVPVGFMYSATGPSTWRDIKVIGNYAYIVSEAANHGLQVFDLTHLRGRTTVAYFEPDATNKEFGNAHNIVSNEDTNFVYVVGATRGNFPNICRGGLMIFDVSSPLNPTFVSCFGTDGYVHDAQCVVYNGPDTKYTSHEICFCYNEDSLTIVDVTDKANMKMIAKTGYINVAYTHQGWLTEDHELVLLDDEQDELGSNAFTKTYVWDVRNLELPELKSVFQSSERSIDHNQYILGDFTFQANYESGLRVLHINRQTEALSLVAYFDVFPSRTTAEFNGAWSVFPYFNSGSVVISSIDYGLFVVKLDWERINRLVESGETLSQQTRVRQLISAGRGSLCPGLTEAKTCFAKLFC